MTDAAVPSLIAALLQHTLERTQLSRVSMAAEVGLEPERFDVLLETDGNAIADEEYVKLAKTINRFCMSHWTPDQLKSLQQSWDAQQSQSDETNRNGETEKREFDDA